MSPGNSHQQAADIATRKDWSVDNIRLTHVSAFYQERGQHAGHSLEDVVRLHFGLKGDYSVSYAQIGKSFDLAGGHHNLFYSPEFDMEFHNKTHGIETFGIQFPRETFIRYTENAGDQLKRFSEKILMGKYAMFSDTWAAINLPVQTTITQILSNPYSGGIQQLFLLSKAIELLVLATESYEDPVKNIFIKNNTDKEKIIAARDIINGNLHSPPNLSQLSRMTGLNEYKLKHGFKEIFQTTVFNYLAEQRLGLALQLLRNTQKSVAEIGYEMGYSTPQHFNNAFRKKFETTPNSVRKNP